ncbi:hypothetical protein GCM10023216_14150 [Isoptericola chiayiensis]|uniref:Uncharacterized protein n=1 Tax=Isoptericola chiayiensis TaxID=579446 RepID=A0ABP8YCX8_9MICO
MSGATVTCAAGRASWGAQPASASVAATTAATTRPVRRIATSSAPAPPRGVDLLYEPRALPPNTSTPPIVCP